MLKKLRIAVLLYVLAFVALGHFLTQKRSTSWELPLLVTIHPIDGGTGAAGTARFERLERAELDALERFFAEEAARYGVRLAAPFRFQVADPLSIDLPELDGSPSFLEAIVFSLRLRWTAMTVNRRTDLPSPDITLFAVFHDGAATPTLDRSLGLQKGLVAVTNLFSDRSAAGSNRVVIAHELLHTLGATDKYDPRTNLPRHPEGYAAPDAVPLLPQRRAELMAGRRPISEGSAEIPNGLDEVVIGPITASEIGWTQ